MILEQYGQSLKVPSQKYKRLRESKEKVENRPYFIQSKSQKICEIFM